MGRLKIQKRKSRKMCLKHRGLRKVNRFNMRPMESPKMSFRYNLTKKIKIQKKLMKENKYFILKPNRDDKGYVALVQSKGIVEDQNNDSSSNVLKVLTVIFSPTQINLNWINKKSSLITMKTASRCLPDVELTYGKDKSLNLLKRAKKKCVKKSNNKNKMKPNTNKNSDGRYQCLFCTKNYKSSTGLSYHLCVHTGDRLKCRFCNEKFIQHTPRKHHEIKCHAEV